MMDVNSSCKLAYQLRKLYGDYSPLGFAVSSSIGQRYFSPISLSVCGDWFDQSDLASLLWDFTHSDKKKRKWTCNRSDWRK